MRPTAKRHKLALLVRRPAYWAAACLAIAMGLSCTESTGDNWPDVVLVGALTNATGTPLAGAELVATVRRPTCADPIFTQIADTSGANGRFRVGFTDPAGRFQGCVAVRVRPTPGAASGEWTIEYPGLDIDASSGVGELDLGTLRPPGT